MKQLTKRQREVLDIIKNMSPTESQATWVFGVHFDIAMRLYKMGYVGHKFSKHAWDYFWYITDNPMSTFTPNPIEYHWLIPVAGSLPICLKVIGSDRFHYKDIAKQTGIDHRRMNRGIWIDRITVEVFNKCVSTDKVIPVTLNYTQPIITA